METHDDRVHGDPGLVRRIVSARAPLAGYEIEECYRCCTDLPVYHGWDVVIIAETVVPRTQPSKQGHTPDIALERQPSTHDMGRVLRRPPSPIEWGVFWADGTGHGKDQSISAVDVRLTIISEFRRRQPPDGIRSWASLRLPVQRPLPRRQRSPWSSRSTNLEPQLERLPRWWRA